MRILRSSQSFPPASDFGPANQALRLTEGLASRGHYSTVVSLGSKRQGRYGWEARRGYSVFWYHDLCAGFGLHIPLHMRLLQSIREFDIVHLHEYRTVQNEIIGRRAYKLQIPFVVTMHGSMSAYMSLARNFSERLPYIAFDFLSGKFLAKKAAAIVTTISAEARAVREQGVEDTRVRIIPHGIEVPPNLDLLRHTAERTDRPTILFAGRISRSRNLETLIRAVNEIRKKKPDIVLSVCGDFVPESKIIVDSNLKEHILALIKRLSLERNVIFHGWLTSDRLWTKFLEADVFVWPSLYDNFGHALVQAAMCGLPLVSTPVGVAPDLIGVDSGGFVVPFKRPDIMASRILSLLDDDLLRKRSGKEALKQSAKYSAENMVASYEKLYTEVCENTR